jgi:hypothetical protein
MSAIVLYFSQQLAAAQTWFMLSGVFPAGLRYVGVVDKPLGIFDKTPRVVEPDHWRHSWPRQIELRAGF